jgi:hypothetical protein
MERKRRTSVPFSHDDSQRRGPQNARNFWTTERPDASGVQCEQHPRSAPAGYRASRPKADRNRSIATVSDVAGHSAPDQFFVRLSNSQPLTSRLAYFRHSCLRFHCRILAKASRAEAVIESGEHRLFIRSAERSDTNIATGRHLTPALASDCRSTACTIWSSHKGPALTVGSFRSARSCAEVAIVPVADQRMPDPQSGPRH